MNKILYLITIITAFIALNANAQTQLWSMTKEGGANNFGTIFKMNLDGSGYTIVYSFDSVHGSHPYGSLMKSSAGTLYGMTNDGGIFNGGVLFSINPNTGVYAVLENFDTNTFFNPFGSLIQINNNLYGMTWNGGADFGGAIFSYDITNSTFIDLADFDYLNGGNPYGDLLLASNGLLYGMSYTGGAYGLGTIISYDTATAVLTDVYDFDSLTTNSSKGNSPYGSLIQPVSGGKLFGMASLGGAEQAGVIFGFKTANNSYSDIYDFPGNYPFGNLNTAATGRLYGITNYGGPDDGGNVFSLNPNSYTYDSLNYFNGTTDGFGPSGSLFQASNGKLYGMTQYGINSSPNGSIFSIDSTSNAITNLRTLSATDGNNPWYSNFIEVPVPSGSIITENVTLTICAGSTIHVPYTATGTFIAGNVFTAQLSDASGSFASPTNIGTLTSTTSGNINSTIPANTPAGIGYRIRVVSSNPAIIGSDNGANITINSLPIVTIIPNGNTTFCQGGSVNLIATAGSSYLWSNGMTTQAITIAVAGNYSVTMTNANGCSAASTATTVTVNPLPSDIVTITGQTIFCQGDSVILSASPGNSYQWSNGLNTQSITITNQGNYDVTVINSNGCTAVSQPIQVTVNLSPQPTITATGQTIFCQGDSVLLTSSQGNSYLWSNGATTISIYASIAGNYKVVVTNTFGCSGVSAATTVTVNSLPQALITANGPTTFCQGDSVVLTSLSGTSYLWSNGLTTQTIVVITSGNFKEVVTNANGCTATSNVITVTVNPSPTATISPIAPAIFCVGDSAIMNCSAAPNYHWSNGATSQSIYATTTGIYTVTVSNSFGCTANASKSATANPLYHLSDTVSICSGSTYTFPDGDTSSSTTIHISQLHTISGCDSNITTTLNVATAIVENIQASICHGETYIFPDGSSSMNDTVETSHFVTITLCDSNIVTNLTVNPNYTINTNATICNGYTYTFPDNSTSSIATVNTSHLTTMNNCDSIIITNLTVTAVDTSVTLVGITLTAQATNATYQWIDCTNLSLIVNATNQSYTPTGNGHYAVVVTQDSCSDTSSCYYIFSTGLNENTVVSSITIYPNPNNGNFIVNVNIENNTTMKIRLTNVLGELIRDEDLTSTNGIFTKEVDLMEQPDGIYFLNLTIGETLVNRKIAVVK